MLPAPPPPYAVAPVAFRFPALATLAGRLPIGAGREAVLATLLAARLAAERVAPDSLEKSLRAARAASARAWLSAGCPDVRVRAACTALAESTEGDDPVLAARALGRVMEVTASHLDAASRSELAALATRLGG